MTAADGPWDPGLQLERTTLAWQRTALLALVAGCAAAKLTWGRCGAAMALIVLLLACSATVAPLAARRHSRAHAALIDGRPLPGGALIAYTSAAVLLGGALAVACSLEL